MPETFKTLRSDLPTLKSMLVIPPSSLKAICVGANPITHKLNIHTQARNPISKKRDSEAIKEETFEIPISVTVDILIMTRFREICKPLKGFF